MDDPRSAVDTMLSVSQCSSWCANFPASATTAFNVITFPAVFFFLSSCGKFICDL
jgi:hypothetical protein